MTGSLAAPAGVPARTGHASSACDICGMRQAHTLSLHDDRYGYPGRFTLLHCTGCGHRRLDVRMSDVQIGDLYTRFYPRSQLDIESWSAPAPTRGLAAWWRGDAANAFRWVPPNVRVLDIGCGFGESLGYHRARGCDAHGAEADANILRVAERHGLNVRHGLFDAHHYEPASFDVVTLDQVVEHVVDPVALLRGIHHVLKPGGLLVLSTPNAEGWSARVFGRHWIHWHAPYHLQFFTPASMARAAADAGLVVEQRRTITNALWLDFQLCHLASLPQAGEASAFWSPKRPRSTARRIALRLARLPHQLGLNPVVTRLMDALHLGDNVLYMLRRPAE
jgi:2-polyprenyl-3-methyl-5-hydroxy-6-metoxy-1,4-benzoquinol methylase